MVTPRQYKIEENRMFLKKHDFGENTVTCFLQKICTETKVNRYLPQIQLFFEMTFYIDESQWKN